MVMTKGDKMANWSDQLQTLHGGDQRRKGASGMTIDQLAAALPAARRSVIQWLKGEVVPGITAQAAIERLYNEQRRSK